MSRMDKYAIEDHENNTPDEEVVLSRVNKNQVMYDNVYFNRTRVDINSVIEGKEPKIEEKVEDEPVEKTQYEPKSYSIRDYLEKAHENKSPDNLKRELNDNDFKEQEDEIRRLIDSINEKEESEDFFKDLKGDDDNTTIGARFKTDEFNDSIYETLKDENMVDDNSILNHALGDKTVLNMKRDEESRLDHTFEKIMLEDEEKAKRKNILPIVIFCILLFTLFLVIAIIILFK